MTKQRAVEIREAEQREAARIAGVQEVVFLREPDGMLQPTLELRKKLVREIRRFRPEAVFTGDPTVVWANDSYINHPDHRAAATAALDAIFPAAGQPNLFEELADEGLNAQTPQGVRDHLGRRRQPLRQYQRVHRNQDRSFEGPHQPDGRLGPG